MLCFFNTTTDHWLLGRQPVRWPRTMLRARSMFVSVLVLPPAAVASIPRRLWLMLLTLIAAFALSQAFRTVTAMLAPGLQAEFGLSTHSLGAFAGLFALSFGVAQLLMGIGMDVYGLRRTLLLAFPQAVLGAALSTVTSSYHGLMLGQVLIGVGCAPVFLSCTVFLARHFPTERFAMLSGLSMGLGGLGMLFTGTPLAWVVERGGWRTGFGVLTGLCLLSWLLVWRVVHEPPRAQDASRPRESVPQALRGMLQLLALPHTWGIVALGMSSYASFLTLRGLWLGPLLIDRFGFSLVQAGHVALAVSLIALFTPVLFGRLDPGPLRRRRWLCRTSLLQALLYLGLALCPSLPLNVVLVLCAGILTGAGVLLYADVRASYPPALTGRALSLYTMAMFLGVALMQWLSGVVADVAPQVGLDLYRGVLLMVAVWLTLASWAFRRLPQSPLLQEAKG